MRRAISSTRGVPMGKDVISPSFHSAFSTVQGLVDFVEEIAEEPQVKYTGDDIGTGAFTLVLHLEGFDESEKFHDEDGKGWNHQGVHYGMNDEQHAVLLRNVVYSKEVWVDNHQ